jgi:hypothetical protein
VLSKRERVIALEAYDKGLLGTTLRYPYEVRKAEDYFCDLPDFSIAPDMLTLAEHILDSKATDFDPATFRDRYEEALLAHLKAKQAGAAPQRRQTFAPPHRVVNLMDALRRSVAEDTKRAAPRKRGPGCFGAQTGVSASRAAPILEPLARVSGRRRLDPRCQRRKSHVTSAVRASWEVARGSAWFGAGGLVRVPSTVTSARAQPLEHGPATRRP